MDYVTATTITCTYTIPASKYLNSVGLQYHAEIFNVNSGIKTNVEHSAITPATIDTPGSVTFTNIPTPDIGVYMLSIYYATSDNLDIASMTKVGMAYCQKVVFSSVVLAK